MFTGKFKHEMYSQSTSSVRECTTVSTVTASLRTNFVTAMLTVRKRTMNRTASNTSAPVSSKFDVMKLNQLIISGDFCGVFSGFFHCRGSDVCISHDLVCDGVAQCSEYRDDERHCDEPGECITFHLLPVQPLTLCFDYCSLKMSSARCATAVATWQTAQLTT